MEDAVEHFMAACGEGFGGVDLAADPRCEITLPALYHARGAVIQAAASAAVAALDVPYLNLASDAGPNDECLRAKSMGLAGKFMIDEAVLRSARLFPRRRGNLTEENK
jgi:(S)-citramalyl-CoA lyase